MIDRNKTLLDQTKWPSSPALYFPQWLSRYLWEAQKQVTSPTLLYDLQQQTFRVMPWTWSFHSAVVNGIHCNPLLRTHHRVPSRWDDNPCSFSHSRWDSPRSFTVLANFLVLKEGGCLSQNPLHMATIHWVNYSPSACLWTDLTWVCTSVNSIWGCSVQNMLLHEKWMFKPCSWHPIFLV